MAKILILGGGFDGLVTAEKLAAALDSKHQITLVSPTDKFTFYPAIPHVVFGKLQPEDITFDLRGKLTNAGVRFIQGEAININTNRREAKIIGADIEGNIHYDFLVIAIGRRLATEKVPGFYESAHHILGINAALKFSDAIENFRGGNITVGMCPDARLPVPVCETAFALAEKFKTEMLEKKISVSVLFPETIEEAFGGAKVDDTIHQAFEKRKINIINNFPIREISANQLFSGSLPPLEYDLTMLIPPFKGQTIVSQLQESSDNSGYAKVNQHLQVSGLSQTYSVGDITALPGPKFAHSAVQQAETAAANIISEIHDEMPQAVYYHEISTIIEGGKDSIYLHYGIWNESLYRLKTGSLWSWAKYFHDNYWQAAHFRA